MSNYEDDDYDFADDDEFDSRGNDKLVKQLRQAQRAAERRAKELENELATFREESRKRSLSDVLTARGLNPKIAAFIPADVSDADGITRWLDEYGDVFGGSTPAPDQGQADEQAQPNGIDVDDFQSFNRTAQSGQAPSGDENQLIAQIRAAKTPEDLNMLLHGNRFGPQQ